MSGVHILKWLSNFLNAPEPEPKIQQIVFHISPEPSAPKTGDALKQYRLAHGVTDAIPQTTRRPTGKMLKDTLDKQHAPHTHMNEQNKVYSLIDQQPTTTDAFPRLLPYARTQQTGAIVPVPPPAVQQTGGIVGLIFVKSADSGSADDANWLTAPGPVGSDQPFLPIDRRRLADVETNKNLDPGMLTGLLPIPDPDEEEVDEDRIPTAKLSLLDTQARVDPGLYRMRQLAKMANRKG
jgi:hypothetical protein